MLGDMIVDTLSNKISQQITTEPFFRNRKVNIFLVFVTFFSTKKY